MKFTLKNVIRNLINVFNGIKVEETLKPEEEMQAKLRKLNEMLRDYFYQDKVNSEKYFRLLQLEYFLITDFMDLKTKEYDEDVLWTIFANFRGDLDTVEWYFFDNDYLLMIVTEIIKNNQFLSYYDYTNLDNSLKKAKTRKWILELHPNIESEEKEIAKQKKIEEKGLNFLEKNICYPFEFFLEVKCLIASGKNMALIKQYVNEKLQQIKENDAELFKKLIAIILKFFYLYYVTNQFSFQKDKAGIANSFAEMLSNMLEETESNEVLLSSVDDIDIYIDILSEVPILYNMPYNKTLEKTLTKKQAHVYEQLNG